MPTFSRSRTRMSRTGPTSFMCAYRSARLARLATAAQIKGLGLPTSLTEVGKVGKRTAEVIANLNANLNGRCRGSSPGAFTAGNQARDFSQVMAGITRLISGLRVNLRGVAW